MRWKEQLTQETKWPHGYNATSISLSMQILQVLASFNLWFSCWISDRISEDFRFRVLSTLISWLSVTVPFNSRLAWSAPACSKSSLLGSMSSHNSRFGFGFWSVGQSGSLLTNFRPYVFYISWPQLRLLPLQYLRTSNLIANHGHSNYYFDYFVVYMVQLG